MLKQCERFESVLLSMTADGLADPAVASHAATCLACQAALVRHRKVLRLLAELRSDEVSVPPTLLDGVLDAVGRAATRSAVRATRSRSRAVSAFGLAGVGVLVGIVVGVEWFLRRPRHRVRGDRGRRHDVSDPGIPAAFELLSSSCQAGAVRSIDRVGEHRRGQ